MRNLFKFSIAAIAAGTFILVGASLVRRAVMELVRFKPALRR